MVANQAEFEVVGRLHVPPDPGLLRAIGLGHGFESAIADLVDNSIDARASRIHIRFVIREGVIDSILVMDDGRGMDRTDIDQAMRLGVPKEDEGRPLGHFGVGLKAASFSQASTLTVLSRKSGQRPQGRRMEREGGDAGFECEVLAEDQVGAALESHLGELGTGSGTVIQWDNMRTVPRSKDPAVTSAFIEQKQNELRHHLGLIFHRLLEAQTNLITLDTLDADARDTGLPFSVEPINPFKYIYSGAPGYPKTMTASLRGRDVPLHCHIWPGGSDSQFFKLSGAPAERHQGFFLYRHDRLLAPGGWAGVAQENKRRKLARVAIDIDDHLDAFSMSMEKTKVRMTADLVRAIEDAKAKDGTTFHDYLATAEMVFRESNRRVRKRSSILPPGQGLPPRVKRTIAREVDFIQGEDPVEIRWARFPGSWDFVEVDREQRILWLNKKYRKAILRGTRGGTNDVPIIKTLLFLLYEDIFRGAAFGAKDKDNVQMWNEILTAAAQAEVQDYDE